MEAISTAKIRAATLPGKGSKQREVCRWSRSPLNLEEVMQIPGNLHQVSQGKTCGAA